MSALTDDIALKKSSPGAARPATSAAGALGTMGDVFHLLWGPRRHIGIFSGDAQDTVPAAAARASRIMAAAAKPQRGERVLEIGCGFGLDAGMLAQTFGCIVIATDSENWRLVEARRLCDKIDGVTVKKADHSALPFPNGTFDLVWATETLSYSPDLHRSVSEAARVLRPGGRLIMSDFTCSRLVAPEPIMTLNHTRQLWSRQAWEKTLHEIGFRIRHREDWSQHARLTYSRIAEEMRKLPQQSAPVREALLNMQQRIQWIDRGAFGVFFAIAERRADRGQGRAR